MYIDDKVWIRKTQLLVSYNHDWDLGYDWKGRKGKS